MIFIILFSLNFSLLAFAQNFNAQLLVGLNAAQVDRDTYGGYNQPGLITGISVFKKANESYNYGLELLFSQKGSQKKTSEDDPNIFKLRYTYLCMPLFVDLKNTGKNMKKFNIRLGVSNNLKIASKVDFGYGWIENTIKPYELSGIVGLGYSFNKNLGLMVRHENSILSIGLPGNGSNYRLNRGLYNRLVSFIFIYQL